MLKRYAVYNRKKGIMHVGESLDPLVSLSALHADLMDSRCRDYLPALHGSWRRTGRDGFRFVVLPDAIPYPPGDYVLSSREISAMSPYVEDEARFHWKRHVHISRSIPFSEIDADILARIVYLACHLNGDTDVVMHRTPSGTTSKTNTLQREDLMLFLGLDYDSYARFARKAIDEYGFILFGGDGTVRLNLQFFRRIYGNDRIARSKWICLNAEKYMEIFETHFHSYGAAYSLGQILRILPYVNYQYNYLCADPTVKTTMCADRYHFIDVVQKLGIRHNHVYRTHDGIAALGEFTDFFRKMTYQRKTHTYLNPEFAYAGNRYGEALILGGFI